MLTIMIQIASDRTLSITQIYYINNFQIGYVCLTGHWLIRLSYTVYINEYMEIVGLSLDLTFVKREVT